MSPEQLRDDLGKLKSEISNTSAEIPEAQNALDNLLQSVDNVLENPAEASFEHQRNLMQRLTDALEHFEVSHPNLTATINTVVATLNRMGI